MGERSKNHNKSNIQRVDSVLSGGSLFRVGSAAAHRGGLWASSEIRADRGVRGGMGASFKLLIRLDSDSSYQNERHSSDAILIF